MVKAKKYVVSNTFQGPPKRDDFKIVEYDLPPLKDGEILLKTEWLSVDPYLRAYNSFLQPPYDQFGFQVGVVQETKDPKFPVGTRVVTHKGWCDHVIVKDVIEKTSEPPIEWIYKLPDLQGLSASLALGAVGMPGATAYLAFLEICKPKSGETVAVSGAAGAVGSLVGQIAKIKGCKVIGFAGTDEKVKWLKELGFDEAFNYKTVNIQTALKEVAPNGVDCYFDNVGGEISSSVMYNMSKGGRVCVVGSISSYNDDPTQLPKVTIVQPGILFKQLKVEGFIIWEHKDRWQEAFAVLVKWIKNGHLKAPEHVTTGFGNIYDAFIGMLNGENFGKAVVKV
ncbi:prostaglandin reductase 1-like [Leptidea sinapis]|uniref:prostaglandin reductase 1-like n=1 Tax=Leptidea sinapis TaxID=189913 RepID=UPI002133A2B9|nr:prostaglandin reductase 1-like [Leptidea sinapis]